MLMWREPNPDNLVPGHHVKCSRHFMIIHSVRLLVMVSLQTFSLIVASEVGMVVYSLITQADLVPPGRSPARMRYMPGTID